MHGLIFNELRKYSEARFGQGAWETLLGRAKASDRMYLPTDTYPDAEMVALVTAACAVTGRDAAALLEDFGEFIAPDLLRSFRSLVRSDWRTLDILENVEGTIHRVVRLQVRDAAPPRLKSERLAAAHVRITYTSARQLCSVAVGIIRGLAKSYGDSVDIAEPECMHRGNSRCVIEVTEKNRNR